MDFKSKYSGFFALFIISLCLFCEADIPPEQNGFRYGGGKKDNSVLIEAFFDPVCPDSRDAWPPLKEALAHYGSRAGFLLHTFPLPYHDNSFATSRALHIINKLNGSVTYDLLEAFFTHQERFYTKATFNLSRSAITSQVVKFVSNELGTSYYSAFKSGFNDTKTDHSTRVSFKYGCLRGVYGTPYFFVNGFPLPDAGSALDYKGWRQVIDPLVKKTAQALKE